MEAQENTSFEEFLKEANEFLKTSKKTLEDCKAMKETIAFALEQWRTNKRWFREEPGRVTTEDVIKMCIEFAWSSKSNFDYTYNKEK